MAGHVFHHKTKSYFPQQTEIRNQCFCSLLIPMPSQSSRLMMLCVCVAERDHFPDFTFNMVGMTGCCFFILIMFLFQNGRHSIGDAYLINAYNSIYCCSCYMYIVLLNFLVYLGIGHHGQGKTGHYEINK